MGRRRGKHQNTIRQENFAKAHAKATAVERPPIIGSQRPLIYEYEFEYYQRRNYDLEITENVVRDPCIGRPLVEMFEHCPEISTAIHRITDSVWSSLDGDNRGFAIAPSLKGGQEKLDADIQYILERFVSEIIDAEDPSWISNHLLAYGDVFCSVGIHLSKRRISQLLPIPTWETYRIEDNSGILEGYEQRRYHTIGGLCDSIFFTPGLFTHWRFRKYKLYGRGLFYNSIDDWNNLKKNLRNLDRALVEIGTNPNVHEFPCETSPDEIIAYRKMLLKKRSEQGVINDYFIKDGTIKKLAGSEPSLKAIFDAIALYRERIIMASCTPPWMLNSQAIGAQDIDKSPAITYTRFINYVRQCLSIPLKQLCFLELALNGIDQSRWGSFKFEWPRLQISAYDTLVSPELNQEKEKQELNSKNKRNKSDIK